MGRKIKRKPLRATPACLPRKAKKAAACRSSSICAPETLYSVREQKTDDKKGEDRMKKKDKKDKMKTQGRPRETNLEKQTKTSHSSQAQWAQA